MTFAKCFTHPGLSFPQICQMGPAELPLCLQGRGDNYTGRGLCEGAKDAPTADAAPQRSPQRGTACGHVWLETQQSQEVLQFLAKILKNQIFTEDFEFTTISDSSGPVPQDSAQAHTRNSSSQPGSPVPVGSPVLRSEVRGCCHPLALVLAG